MEAPIYLCKIYCFYRMIIIRPWGGCNFCIPTQSITATGSSPWSPTAGDAAVLLGQELQVGLCPSPRLCMGVSHQWGYPNRWMVVMENPIQIDDLEVPPFRKAPHVLNGRKRNANATFAQNLKSTCILQLLHLGSKDVESITASVLTVDIFVGVSLIHDQQERVFITLDSFEKQAKGLVVTHIACQDSPGFQKLITCSNIFEAKLDCQAPCTLIAWMSPEDYFSTTYPAFKKKCFFNPITYHPHLIYCSLNQR